MSETQIESGFKALNVSPALCAALGHLKIVTPTPIQEGAIPLALEGKDVVGIAQTGTGKTLAFAVPIADLLGRNQNALVLAPTRELAEQIAQTLNLLRLRTALVVGGASIGNQIRDLRNRPDVIVATPGRLMDHMERGTVRLNYTSIVVLDEADRMFDMGFAPAIKKILEQTPEARQTMLFSATMPPAIEDLAANYLHDPERVEVARQGSTNDLVDQAVRFLEHEGKRDALAEILGENDGTVLVFSRTKHGARKLATSIRQDGHTASEIHADRSLAQRREALAGFKSGRYRVLVATDIAARGIDVKDISMVVNYDVPENPEDYVHRIGRTGRAGAKGRAVTFALTAQDKNIRLIEKLLGNALPLCERSTAVPRSRRGHQPLSEKNPYREQRFKRQHENREQGNPGDQRPTRSFNDRPARPERNHQDDWNRPRPTERQPYNRDNSRPNDRPQNDRPQYERPRYERQQDERPQYDRSSNERPQYDRPRHDDQPRTAAPFEPRNKSNRKPKSEASIPKFKPAGDKRAFDPKAKPDGAKAHRGWSGKPKKRNVKR